MEKLVQDETPTTPGQKLRVISANVRGNRALRDPGTLETVMPDDDTPTLTAFQEILPAGGEAIEAIRDRGYRALLLGSHSLGFAFSSNIAANAETIKTFTYPGVGYTGQLGLYTIGATLGDHSITFANGHLPRWHSPHWRTAADYDAGTFGRLVDKRPDNLIIGLRGGNHATAKQRRYYTENQEEWGAVQLVPDGTATRHSRFHLLSRLGMSDPQLDGIQVRIPPHMQLHVTDVSTVAIDSSHDAVIAELELAGKTD